MMDKDQLVFEYWEAYAAAYGALPPKEFMYRKYETASEEDLKERIEYLQLMIAAKNLAKKA